MLRLLLCFLCCYSLTFISEGAAEENCGEVITDESQARECLNWPSSDAAPLPVILEATTSDREFICADRTPLYTFYCTVNGNDLIWYFNGDIVTGFVPGDLVGRTVIVTYPRNSDQVYTVTTVLTHVSKTLGTSIPICVSILTVQPFNESQRQFDVLLPFSVSCQSHCQGETRTQVCQAKHKKAAATPSNPRKVMGNITSTTLVGGSVASVSWLPPANQDETTIDYYELTLTGPNTSSTTFKVHTAASLPYKVVVPEGNFSTASMTAVDVCGQRSEPSQSRLNFISGSSPSLSAYNIERQEQLQDAVGALASVTGLIGISLCIVIVNAVILIVIRRKPTIYKVNWQKDMSMDIPVDDNFATPWQLQAYSKREKRGSLPLSW